MMTEARRWQGFLALSMGWVLSVVVLYATTIREIPIQKLRALYASTHDFFLWQAAGYLLCGAIAASCRSRLLGRICVLFLGGSTVALLSLSRDVWFVARFALFLLWCCLAVSSTRIALGRWIGLDRATWGLAAGTLFSGLLPLTFLLSLAGLMARWPVAILAVATALPGAIYLVRHGRSEVRAATRWVDELNPVGAAALGAAWVGLAVALVWAQAPETEPDSIQTHLPFMQQLARDGGFDVETLDFRRRMVYGVRIAMTAGLALGSVEMAKGLSWFAAVALLVLVAEEVSRRSGRLNLGVLAGSAIATTPLVLSLSRTLYDDHIITLLCVTAFVSLLRGLGTRSSHAILLSAFVMGCAIQAKYNVLVFGTVWVLTLLTCSVKRLRLARGLKRCALPLIVLALVGCPPYLHTWITSGNPVFPNFNEVFGSPYWPKNQSTDFDLSTFGFDAGVKSTLLFPWWMTFHSSQIDRLPDGRLGFLLLALLPFVAALIDRRCRSGLDLGLVGLAGFLAICWKTPYARYWFPMYPLIVMPLFLALGETVGRARWRLTRSTSPVVGAGVFLALLVTLPILLTEKPGLPWKLYVRRTSEQEWMARQFVGVPAVSRLNERLKATDRVLVTGYKPVFTVDAEAYIWPFWQAQLASVRDAASLDAFLARHGIRYWVVDHAGRDALLFGKRTGADSTHWTDSKWVAGSSTVGVYATSAATLPAPSILIDRREVGPRLLSGTSAGREDGPAWQDLFAGRDSQASIRGDVVDVPPGGAISYDFPIPEKAESCRILIARIRSQDAVLSLRWIDDRRRTIGRLLGNLSYPRARLPLRFFGQVPENAEYGEFVIRPWGSTGLQLGETSFAFRRSGKAVDPDS